MQSSVTVGEFLANVVWGKIHILPDGTQRYEPNWDILDKISLKDQYASYERHLKRLSHGNNQKG